MLELVPPTPIPVGSTLVDDVKFLLKIREADRDRLDKIHDYLHGQQDNPMTPKGVPRDVKSLAKISRVNMMKIIVNSVTQALYVDGFRGTQDSQNAAAWDIWQANKLDRGQIAVHRAALTYGTAYVSVLPDSEGQGIPIIRGHSPRRLTAVFESDPDRPVMALEVRALADRWLYRLIDDEAVTEFEQRDEKSDIVQTGEQTHGLGVCPIVPFVNEQDLDEDNDGEVEPLFDLQDQVDITTFSLLVAQHYTAFRQRYIIGWTAESEEKAIKANASRLMVFEDPDVKVGEFSESTLEGYLKSREDSLKQMASISQTPVHELIGSLVNLSAEALVAAEASQRRKITERQTGFGESWESVLELAAEIGDVPMDDQAQIRWRDTEDRALAATVDALGKIATMLHVPPQELWEKIPGTTQADVSRWKKTFTENSPINALMAQLEKQTPTAAGGDQAAG
jgi:hypothetical protein